MDRLRLKVTRKNEENLSGSYPVRILEGKEYLCTVSNVQMRCVRNGRWNWHNVKSTTDVYDNSSVIAYFDRLNDGALPSHVIQAVELSHAKKLFSDDICHNTQILAIFF